VRQGLRFLRAELPGILAKRTDVLSPHMLRIIEDLAGDWRRLDERIESLSNEIEMLACQDEGCNRLASGQSSPARWWLRTADQSKVSNNDVANLGNHWKGLKRTFVLNPLMGSMLLAVLDVRCRAHIRLVDDMCAVALTPRTLQRVGAAGYQFEVSLFDGNTRFFGRFAYRRPQRCLSKVQATTW
jgi:hypothetical protein